MSAFDEKWVAEHLAGVECVQSRYDSDALVPMEPHEARALAPTVLGLCRLYEPGSALVERDELAEMLWNREGGTDDDKITHPESWTQLLADADAVLSYLAGKGHPLDGDSA